jgi:hypothetical protein
MTQRRQRVEQHAHASRHQSSRGYDGADRHRRRAVRPQHLDRLAGWGEVHADGAVQRFGADSTVILPRGRDHQIFNIGPLNAVLNASRRRGGHPCRPALG